MMAVWKDVTKELPNEDEIYYNGVGAYDGSERTRSDRVLAIDKNGFIRTGYFMKSAMGHPYYGNGITNIYSHYGRACWEFGEHYRSDPTQWVVSVPNSCEITHWIELPKFEGDK